MFHGGGARGWFTGRGGRDWRLPKGPWKRLGNIGERVLFENGHVRVWENVLEPGEESEVHRHDYDYLALDIEGDRVIHNPVKDGHFPRMEYEVNAGFSGCLRGGVTETAINTGTTRLTILVELLDDPR